MDPVTAMYVAQGMHGLAYGMILFLLASGLTLIFGMMGILNLAHATFFMLSAYLCYQVLTWTGSFWLALLIAPIVTGLIGILLERFLVRKQILWVKWFCNCKRDCRLVEEMLTITKEMILNFRHLSDLELQIK